MLGGLLDEPDRPFVAVVGGAKVADKLGVLEALAAHVDVLVVGGAMAFTFLAAMGHDVGASLVDAERIEDCRRLLTRASTSCCPPTWWPSSPAASSAPGHGEPGPGATPRCSAWTCLTAGQGLDIGPETASAFAEAVADAGTVLWNGPLGVVEDDRFLAGTAHVAQAIAHCPGFTVVGGGDSASVLDRLGLTHQISFLSTGGGASLALVEKGDLPALIALRGAANAPVGRSRGLSAECPAAHRWRTARRPRRPAAPWSAATGRCTTTTSRPSIPCATSACA